MTQTQVGKHASLIIHITRLIIVFTLASLDLGSLSLASLSLTAVAGLLGTVREGGDTLEDDSPPEARRSSGLPLLLDLNIPEKTLS
jgi:hypothetical protein